MKNIEVISRAVLLNKKKILVCKDKKNKNYFLPGGHVEFGEFSKDALLRELKEEVSLDIKKAELIGVVENFYTKKKEDFHEVNFFYYVTSNKREIKSNEDHLDFFLFNKKEFSEKDVRPKEVKKAILSWIKNKKFFYIKTIDL